MALTWTITDSKRAGPLRYVYGTVAFDNSYPTGGEAVTAADVGMKHALYDLIVHGEDGWLFEFDRANLKVIVRAFRVDDDDNAATAGIALYCDHDAVQGSRIKCVTAGNADVDCTLTEAANTADLNGVTAAPFLAIGF